MDHNVIAAQKLTIEIINKIDETKITSYRVIVGALALALVTTFRAIKEDHGLQVMDQVKVDFYTFLSIAMQDEGTVKREDLN